MSSRVPTGSLGAAAPPCRPAAVVVEGPVSAELARQCAALGLRVADGGESCPRVRLGEATEDLVRQGMAAPYQGFVELGEDGLAGVGPRCFDTARRGGISLSLKTSSVYALSTLELVSQAIRGRLGMAGNDAADLIDICLGEAISNAVMHGNLEVPAHLRINAKGFQLFRDSMQERLNDPVLACRRIEINVLPLADQALSLMVTDQGRGFDLAEQLTHRVDSDAKRGRGLGLIKRVCGSLLAEDGGRTLVMTFGRE